MIYLSVYHALPGDALPTFSSEEGFYDFPELFVCHLLPSFYYTIVLPTNSVSQRLRIKPYVFAEAIQGVLPVHFEAKVSHLVSANPS